MYSKYRIFWIIFFVVMLPKINGKCSIEENCLKCIGTDMEELSSFYLDPNQYENIIIENSTLDQLEFLPTRNYGSITIKHSGLKVINKGDLNVENLDLSYNVLKKTSFLNCISNLNILNLSHNNIEYLNGTQFYINNLYEIDLSYNKIANFENLYNYDLEILNLSNNRLEYLDHLIANLNSLRIVNLSNNKLLKLISDNFPNRIFDILDANNNQLIYFDSNIEVKRLDLSQNPLNIFNWTSSEITFLNLSNSNVQIHWNLENSNSEQRVIIDFSKQNLANLDFMLGEESGNNNIWTINLSDNNLTFLDFAIFEYFRIESIDLSMNKIDDITAETFGEAEIIDLSYNNFKYFDLSIIENITNLYKLNLSHNPLETLTNSINSENSKNIRLNVLDLSFCSIKRLDVKFFENLRLQHLNFSHNSLGILPDFTGLEYLEFLDLSNTGIENLDNFDVLKNLKILKLDNNRIEIIPQHFLTRQNMESLSMRGNKISKIHPEAFSYFLKLTEINMTFEYVIKAKSFWKFYHLEVLNIVDSMLYIKKGSFRGLINLKNITLTNSFVAGLEPGAFNGLLNVRYSNFKNFFKLIKNIQTNTFVGLKSLQLLDLSDVGLKTLEIGAFSGLESLQILNLSRNNFKLLPKNAFVGLSNLQQLDLSRNKLINFETGGFSTNLKLLNLSNNQLSYLNRYSVFSLKFLEILDINSNNLNYFEYQFILKNLLHLKMIGIGGNKWEKVDLSIMLNSFQEHNVDYSTISVLEYDLENIDGIYTVNVS